MLRLTYLLLLIFSTQLFAQGTQKLTYEDIATGAATYLKPTKLTDLQWIPGTESYSYIKKDNNEYYIAIGTVSSEDEKLVSLNDINELLEADNLGSAKTLGKITWIDDNRFTFWVNNYYVSYNVNENSITKLNGIDDLGSNEAVSPNNELIAYTIDNNLFISLKDGTSRQITFDEDPGITNGADNVHRNEFGIDEGIFWSPKSSYTAFYRMDQTMVTDYPVVDYTTRPAVLASIKYPMAGQTSHHVTLGVHDVNNDTTVWLETGEPAEQYLTSVTWGPEEKFIYVGQLNRDQNHLRFIKYDAETGKRVKVLFEDKHEKYIEPDTPLHFLPNGSSKFILASERDGWRHIYLYDTEGNMLKQLTEGEWVVTEFIGFDEPGEYAFIQTTKETPLEEHYYKLDMESGEMVKLTPQAGTHDAEVNTSGEYLIDVYSNLETPHVTQILNDEGGVVKTLHKSRNPYAAYETGKVEIFPITGKDGTELYCRMYYPVNFDEKEKYPVIVYVYGGPHSQGVENTFFYGYSRSWFRLMAQQGYIIFSVDNRGTEDRGLEFEQATFRKLGTVELQDQMEGVRYLLSLPYVDRERLGVHGWSYGGFMATTLMLRSGGLFKVGVAGGAVIDWKLYEAMYTERYMDTPETNPEGYEESNLLNYVDNLQGKFLHVHGTSDPTVVWQNTLKFASKAAVLNKDLDYYPYIGHGHHIKGAENINLYQRISEYFLENL